MRTLKLKIPDELFDEMGAAVKILGYSSMDELILHAIEKNLTDRRDTIGDAIVQQQLKGLGYVE